MGETQRETDVLHLLKHIAAMADDAYLVGHPEWIEILAEARKLQ